MKCDDCMSKRSVHDGKYQPTTSPAATKFFGQAFLTVIAVRSDGEVTFHNVTGTGSLQWLVFHYKVNDPEGK